MCRDGVVSEASGEYGDEGAGGWERGLERFFF
jgi:hypothetical protein